MGKNLHASAPSAPTYVWIRGEKKLKENDRTKEAVCGARGGGGGKEKCEGAGGWVKFPCIFFTGSAPKTQTFFSFFTFFFPFSKSNLPAAKDIKFKQSFFSLSVHISRD